LAAPSPPPLVLSHHYIRTTPACVRRKIFPRQVVLTSHATIFWLAIDRNPERPKLMLRQGPWVFLIDLSRRDDYYHADKLRWLQHVSMGPLRVEGAPETPGQPSGAGSEKSGSTPPKGADKGPQG
jgi:hypothetical protein